MASLKDWMFATGKLLNQLFQNFCDLTHDKDLHFRIQINFGQISSTQRYFSVVLFRHNCCCQFGKNELFDNFLSHLSSIQAQII